MNSGDLLELVALSLKQSLLAARHAKRDTLCCPLGHYKVLSHQPPACGREFMTAPALAPSAGVWRVSAALHVRTCRGPGLARLCD